MTARIAIVAALERELKPLIKNWRVVEHQHGGRSFRFFEGHQLVVTFGGIGAEAARRVAEATIALYAPELIVSAGFAGALDASLKVGDSFVPHRILDAGDGSASDIGTGTGTLVTFNSIASAEQKTKLSSAYAAQAVDMEAAAVARAAHMHGVRFACIKAISDDRNFEMPRMDRFIGNGKFDTTRFVAYAIVRPWLWLRVMRLAKNTARATATLCRLFGQYNQDPEFLENVPAGLHLISKFKG